MRMVVFSDLHIHAWAAFSRLTDDGVNDRLSDTLRVLKIVRETAQEEYADAVVFAGDLFHVQKIDAEVLALTSQTVAEEFSKLSIPILAIEGNHDQAARVRELTSVSGLRVPKNWHWLRSSSVTVKGVTIWGTPFGSNDLPDVDPDVAVLHRGILGAEVSDYFQSPFEDDLKPEDASQYASKLVICGHYHKPQKIVSGPVPILIPGAPIQHTWGDASQERGLWVVDIKDGMVECDFRPLKDFPRFIRVNESNLEALGDSEGNFVSVELGCSIPADELTPIVEGLSQKARSYSIQANDPKSIRPPGERVQIATDLESAIREYATKFAGERANVLSALGMEILRQARS